MGIFISVTKGVVDHFWNVPAHTMGGILRLHGSKRAGGKKNVRFAADVAVSQKVAVKEESDDDEPDGLYGTKQRRMLGISRQRNVEMATEFNAMLRRIREASPTGAEFGSDSERTDDSCARGLTVKVRAKAARKVRTAGKRKRGKQWIKGAWVDTQKVAMEGVVGVGPEPDVLLCEIK